MIEWITAIQLPELMWLKSMHHQEHQKKGTNHVEITLDVVRHPHIITLPHACKEEQPGDASLSASVSCFLGTSTQMGSPVFRPMLHADWMREGNATYAKRRVSNPGYTAAVLSRRSQKK